MITWIKEKADIINGKYKEAERKYRTFENKLEVTVQKFKPVKQSQSSKETIKTVELNRPNTEKQKQQERSLDFYKEMQDDIARDEKVRKQAIQWIKEKKFLEAIEILDEEIGKREDMLSSYELYKMKAVCLYKTGNGNEAWIIYNDLQKYFIKNGQDSMYFGVYREQTKQLEYEKKYKDAFIFHIKTRLFEDRYKFMYHPEGRKQIDVNWEVDSKIQKVAKKANIDWQPIKNSLVEDYKGLKSNNVKNPEYIEKIIQKLNSELQ